MSEAPSPHPALANQLAMRLGARAVATLSVVGHRTGGPRTLPVIPVEVG
ncbi:MAG TPA: hypothetical protein VIJ07_19710 [Dermatophilaceae bacterium]|jgi:hypothetical protein